jgi:ABC-2 type transport system permease protein
MVASWLSPSAGLRSVAVSVPEPPPKLSSPGPPVSRSLPLSPDMVFWRPSVLAGHVLGNLILTAVSVAVVIAMALAIGFSPTAGPLEWLAVVGLLVLVALALTWLSVALGLLAKSVETASNTPMFLFLLPFLGSGFVPTDSMPAGLRWFADNQPFTPITDTFRGLLGGDHVGGTGAVAVAWCLAIAAAGFVWANYLYNRRSAR